MVYECENDACITGMPVQLKSYTYCSFFDDARTTIKRRWEMEERRGRGYMRCKPRRKSKKDEQKKRENNVQSSDDI